MKNKEALEALENIAKNWLFDGALETKEMSESFQTIRQALLNGVEEVSVVSMRDAIRTGNIDSPEIGDASTGNHKWHEEWESYSDKALQEYTNFMKDKG